MEVTTRIKVTTGTGPRCLKIPAGSISWQVKAHNSGTIKLKVGTQDIVACSPETGYDAPPLPLNINVALRHPAIVVEFSGGDGVASYTAVEDLGAITEYDDGDAIATVTA